MISEGAVESGKRNLNASILTMSALNGENSGSRGTSFENASNIYSSNELHIIYEKVLYSHPSST
jgi:hypothetical protein